MKMQFLIIAMFAFIFIQGRPSLASTKNKCLSAAQASALAALKNEDEGSGLVDDVKPKYLSLNNGGIYVIQGWIQRTFDWQVIVTVDRNCIVKTVYISDL